MSGVSFSGIGTGIDWSKIVEYELARYEKTHVAPLEKRMNQVNSKVQALSGLDGKLSDLRNVAATMDDPSELLAFTSSSSDESVVTASASGSASAGTYSVEVNQLADAEVEIHTGLDDSDTLVNNTGSTRAFSYTYAQESVELSVADGTTLQELVDLINNDSANPGVTASILDDGSGGTTSHHLVLRGNDTGADYTISINADETTLAGEWGTLTTDAAAGNSSVDVDDASPFAQYQAIIIGDDNSSGEYHIVDSISNNTLNLRGTLSSDFETAQNAYATPRGTGSGLAAAADAGASEISVDDASHFQEGKTVLIADAGGYEEATISEIDTVNNILTISSNLSTDYAETAYVTQLEGGRNFTFEPTDFDEMKAARNSRVRVDGYPPSGWIEAENNVIDGAIGGLSLTLLQTTDGSPVTVSVNRNTESVKTKIHALVSTYNEVRTYINRQTRYDPSTGESGALLGNYGAGIVESLFQDTIVTPATGFSDGTESFTVLGQVGIHSVATADDRTQLGTLEIDDQKLDEALVEDFKGVVELFSANFSGASNSEHLTFYQASEALTTPGEYDVKVDFDGSGNITGAWMKSASDETYREADIEGDCIVGQSDNPEDSLWVLVEWDGSSSTQTATVRVKQGLAGELLSEVDDLQDTDGLLENMNESSSERRTYMREQIEEEMTRMQMMEQRLNQKYARLESMLSELQGLQQWVSSMTRDMGKATSMSQSQD